MNESDAEVAAKISKNADDITEIVKELIDKASGGVVDFEPEISSFYLTELTDFLSDEYGKRLDVLRIPYKFEVEDNAMIKSDKNGLCRILSQLLENAIKYGNGEGIFVNITKDDEGYFKLTEAGEILAKRIYERHTVLTTLFINLGVDEKTASEDACRIEHYISDKTFNAVKAHMKKYGV